MKRSPGNDPIETPLAASAEVPRVVVVDDDTHAAEALLSIARTAGYATARASTPAAASDSGPRSQAMVMVVDIEAIGGRLEQIAHQLRAGGRPHQLLVTAADAGARQVLRWIHEGASDVLPKPFDADEVRAALDRAAMRLGCAVEDSGSATTARAADPLEIVGADPRLRDALALARAASGVASTVLVHGESGTGKSMLARAIHEMSDRRDGPFVEIACGSIPEALLESELFGHVKGSFTGAIADRKGRFLAANGGTIFLDEINSAPPAMQLKLLRVLQEHRFEPVGSEQSLDVDVRVIVASNQPLERLVEEGRFRQDLYYRVQVIAIDLPPLRERPADIEALALHFLARKAAEARRTCLGFTPDAMRALRAYHWPGNVRDLENAIERAVVLGRDARIGVGDLPERVMRTRATSAPTLSTHDAQAERTMPRLPATEAGAPRSANNSTAERPELCETMRASERRRIVEALDECAGNRTRAARALGIDRSTLYRKMIDLGLAVPRDQDRAA
ncbi:MAG: sigma-54 dependent transcriptional regulator [Planctomycetaceae bacterium]|nr:sigma-54 dependent transcriptional regulator [Planctomycetaceae bacterium]